MKDIRISYTSILTVLLLSTPISTHAVTGMSSEEMAFREAHEKEDREASIELYECLAKHNVHPSNVEETHFCRREKEKSKKIVDKFNTFMRQQDSGINHRDRRESFNKFNKKYSSYTESDLRKLHQKHCVTKWGSSASVECQAIASQIAARRYEAQ